MLKLRDIERIKVDESLSKTTCGFAIVVHATLCRHGGCAVTCKAAETGSTRALASSILVDQHFGADLHQ